MARTAKTSGKQLNLANLQHIDKGRVSQAVNHAIQQVIADAAERPGDDNKRQVIIKIEAKPRMEKDMGTLDTIDFKFDISTKLPPRISDPYPMLPLADGTVTFQPDAPTDPRQQTMFIDDEKVDAETGEVLKAVEVVTGSSPRKETGE